MFFHLTRRVYDTGLTALNAGFSEKEAKVLLSEVTLGLIHMHKHSYIHCDIKVENIMLDARGHVKLIDFGLATKLSSEKNLEEPIVHRRGSLIYMAPELLTKGASREEEEKKKKGPSVPPFAWLTLFRRFFLLPLFFATERLTTSFCHGSNPRCTSLSHDSSSELSLLDLRIPQWTAAFDGQALAAGTRTGGRWAFSRTN